MVRRIRAAVVAALLAACAIGLRAQDGPPQPTFRAGVEAVEVTAYVTDRDGNPVTDLTPDDFELVEDGVPQVISSFALVDVPVERLERPLFTANEIEPDVQSNTGPEGRLYVVLIDEVPAGQAQRIRHFLRPFFEEQFGANDVGAIIYLGRAQSSSTQGFTSSRRLLLDAVEKVQPGYGDPFSDLAAPEESVGAGTVEDTGEVEPDDIIEDPDARQALLNRRESWDTRTRMRNLREVVESIAAIPGRRKAVLYVTTSVGMDVFDVLDYAGGAKTVAFDDLHRTIAAATRGGVAFYPINPCGLDSGVNGGDAPSGCASGLGEAVDLRALANATGGFAAFGTNDFEGNLTQIVRENSTYYLLGFSSTNDRRDGRFRDLDVRVRRPGLTVRTRDGYLEPNGRADEEEVRFSTLPVAVADALKSPLPERSVPLRASAVAFRGPDRQANVAVALELEAASLGLVEQQKIFRGEIAMATLAVEADGDVRPGQRFEAELLLPPEKHDRAVAGGVRMLTEMQLPAGRYQLRLVAGTKQRTGSVVYDLDVPDFTKGPLAMSGVALTTESSRLGYTIPQVDHLGPLLPGPLTAAREFPRGDELTVYAEVYENGRQPEHTVDVEVALRSDTGRAVRTSTEQRSSRELSRREANGFAVSLPLDVEPGLYVIHVQATANIDDRPTVGRDVVIRVR